MTTPDGHRVCGWLIFGTLAGIGAGQLLTHCLSLTPQAPSPSWEYGRAWIAILMAGGVCGALGGAVVERLVRRGPRWLDWVCLALLFLLWAIFWLSQINQAVE